MVNSNIKLTTDLMCITYHLKRMNLYLQVKFVMHGDTNCSTTPVEV